MPNRQQILLYGGGAVLAVSAFFVYRRFFTVKGKAVTLAKKEYKKWKGGKEYQPGYAEQVGKYWKEGVGYNYDGYDRDVAWSAAFISWIMKNAGAKDKFKYSSSHSTYIRDSIANRKLNLFKKPFVGFKIDEYAPKVGDLVCYSREDNPDLYDVNTPYKSHCDLVVKKGDNYIEVIGGNVSQAVTAKKVTTDNNGYVIDKNKNWFAVLKNNM